jgi:O-antigen/teichoic acid export membrane protein
VEARPSAGDDVSSRAILATAKGGGFLAGGNLYEFAARFVIAFLLARLLGADGYGLYTLAISAAAIFSGIAALGLDDAMVRYVAIMSRRDDPPGLWGTLQIGLGVGAVAGVVVAAVLYAAAEPVAVGLFDEPQLAPLLELLALVMPALTIGKVLLGCARGFSRMDYAAVGQNIVQSTVRVVLLGALALVGMDVFAALVVFVIADISSSFVLVVLLNREFAFRRPIRREVRHDVRDVFGFALPLWLSGLLNQFRRNIEVVLLGALSSVTSVGIYSIVTKVNMLGHVAYRAIIVSVKPTLASLHDAGDRRAISDLYATTTRWTLALNIPFFLIMVLYAEPLLSVFGPTFTVGAGALIVLAVGELIIGSTGISGSIIDMTGHVRVKLANTVLAITLLLGTSALLIPRWGVMGAAVASLAAGTVIETVRVLEVWFLEHVQPYRWSITKPLLAGLTALASGLVLQRALPIDGSLALAAAQGVGVLLVYAAATLVLGLTPEDRLVLGRVRRSVTRRLARPTPRIADAATEPTSR